MNDERVSGGSAQGDVERRGAVWVTFVKMQGGSVSVPMPAVPRVDELVHLGGDDPDEHWRVVQVIWKAPVGFSEAALMTLNLSELPPVQVFLDRSSSTRR